MRQRIRAGVLLLLFLFVFLAACDTTEEGEGSGFGGVVSTDAEGNYLFTYTNSEPLYYDDENEPSLNNIRIDGETVYVEWYCKNEWEVDSRYASAPFTVEEYMLHQGTLTLSEDKKTAELRIPNSYLYKMVISGEGAEEYRTYLKENRVGDTADAELVEKTLNGEYGLTARDSRMSGMGVTVTIDWETGRFTVMQAVVYEDDAPSMIAVFDDHCVKKQFFDEGVLSEQEELTQDGNWERYVYYDDGSIQEHSLRTPNGEWLWEYRYYEDGTMNYCSEEDENGNRVTYGYNEDGIVYHSYVKYPNGAGEGYDYYETGAVRSYQTTDVAGKHETRYYDREGTLTSSAASWVDDEGNTHSQYFYADGSLKSYTVYDENWDQVRSESYGQGECFPEETD